MECTWSGEQLKVAQQIVMERFAQNSVAGHLASQSIVDDIAIPFQGTASTLSMEQ